MNRLWPAVALSTALAAPAAAAKAPPNIVLVVVDALRPDHLTPYGYSRDTSPRLAELAAEGVVFTNAYAASNWTLPALSSLMTGLYPSAHGAYRRPERGTWARELAQGRYFPPPGARLDPARRTLASALAARGYRTEGIVSGGFCRSAFGFGSGFGRYYDGGGTMRDDLMPKILASLDRDPGSPFFLYIHDGDVHDPYDKGSELGRRWDPDYDGDFDGSRKSFNAFEEGKLQPSERDLRHLAALYDGGIAFADRALGSLLDALESRGLSKNTIVVVTADHGESLGEHGFLTHGRGLFEEVLKIPLIVRLPDGPRGLRVDVPVSEVDVMPTLVEAAGAAVPPETQGRSLLSALRGGALAPADVFAEEKPGGACVRRGPLKYVERKEGAMLFDLAADPAESRDVSARLADAGALQQALRDWRAATRKLSRSLPASPARGPRAVDAGLRDKLKATGYLQ